MEVPGNTEEPRPVRRFAAESFDSDECANEGVLSEIGGISRLTTHSSEVRVNRVFMALEFWCKLVLLFHIPQSVASTVVNVTRNLSGSNRIQSRVDHRFRVRQLARLQKPQLSLRHEQIQARSRRDCRGIKPENVRPTHSRSPIRTACAQGHRSVPVALLIGFAGTHASIPRAADLRTCRLSRIRRARYWASTGGG